MNDRPDALNALKHVLLERSNSAIDEKDAATAKKVSEMLHGISLADTEREAKE